MSRILTITAAALSTLSVLFLALSISAPAESAPAPLLKKEMEVDKLVVKELVVAGSILVRSACGKHSVELHTRKDGAGVWLNSPGGTAMILSGYHNCPSFVLSSEEHSKSFGHPFAVSLDKHGTWIQIQDGESISSWMKIKDLLKK